MILGVDAQRLLGQPTGVARVLEALLHHFDESSHPFGEIRLYSPEPLLPDDRWPAASRAVTVRGRGGAGLWQQVHPPRAHGAAGLLLCPSYTVPLLARKPIALIHHGSYEGYPSAFPLLRRLKARAFHTLSARSATHIFTVSEHSKRDILQFYGVSESKVEVIHNGVDTTLFRPPEDPAASVEVRRKLFGEDAPFVLYVGNANRRRNLDALTEAFARVRERHGARHRLLFVGFELEGTTVHDVAQRCGVEPYVQALPHVDHHQLATLYGAADVFAYPSSYEGFGLPVLEAMACGTPTLALDATAFPEFAAGAAELLPNAHVDTLETGLDRLLGDSELRESLRREGPRRAADFDWRRVTARYVEALGTLARRYAHDG